MSPAEQAWTGLREVVEAASDEALWTLGGIVEGFPWHDGTAPARPVLEALKRVVVAAYFDRLGEPYDLDTVMALIGEESDHG
ncbi:hypothetical protein [Nonomuraea basaltis]|uniref:hypothetical protein n=1 Tax=Nonomuraea basaltis TaxID=2495887 RepID=UPI00110C49F2|nr:hypothetical protein [Nonomuraea basaltis]TMR95593.1 hypothetical protein EJK15_27950 [Nonomuraea basaltis]